MMRAVMWVVFGSIVGVLLLVSALMDHSARRRGARVRGSGEIWHDLRDANRDSRVLDSGLLPPRTKDAFGWTSWSRRNNGGR